MKYFYTLGLSVLFLANGFSQQMPLDFSSSSDVFNTWGGATFAVVPDPSDSSNPVGEFTRASNPNPHGHFIDLSQPVDLDVEDEITLRFYSFSPSQHTVYVRLELGTNPDVEVQQNVTSQNTWTDMTFDFSTVSGSGQYGRLVIRINDGTLTPGTFLIDDINDGSVPGDENELDVIYNDLVWSDEFDGSSLDLTKWHHQTFGPNGGQWFNNEEQHYTDSPTNSFVSNGNLHIVAKKETVTQNGVTLDYTSARLNSKYAFTYGRVDVRAKLPFGDGTWPAIWTLGKNIDEEGAYWETQGFGTTSWPACGEIDIMEHGLHATNEVSCAIHTPSSFGATVNTETFPLPDVANNYHVYSMNWSPNQITFMIDGVGYYTYNPVVKDANTWPFDLDQYLILNIAMGGFAGTVDPNFTQSSMLIDYVRVYQNVLDTDRFIKDKVKVYPNPSSEKLFIDSPKHIIALQLYDIQGRKVYSSSENTVSIDISGLQSGMYFLKIQGEKGVVSKKVIVE
jgi:beta-glucanase (GH16 family)